MKKEKQKTKEDSIDVSTANAENRFSAAEAAEGVTKEGGNASADVKKQGGKTEESGARKNQNDSAKDKKQSGSRTGNLGKTTQP